MNTQEKELKDELSSLKDIFTNIIGIPKVQPNKVNGKLTDIVKTIDDVYEYLCKPKPTLGNYVGFDTEDAEYQLNMQYIKDIAKLFNEGWIPDFNNSKEYKYFPYYQKQASGWGFYGSDYCFDSSLLGSGFYYKSEEISNYVGKQFIDIYIKILN